MRLFGTLKGIEIYLILAAILLIFTFNQLCEKKEKIFVAAGDGKNNMVVSSKADQKEVVYSAGILNFGHQQRRQHQQEPSSNDNNHHHEQQHPSTNDHQNDNIVSTGNKTIIMASVPESSAAKNDKSTLAKPTTRAARIELIQPDKVLEPIIIPSKHEKHHHEPTTPITIKATDTNSKHDPAAAPRFQYLKAYPHKKQLVHAEPELIEEPLSISRVRPVVDDDRITFGIWNKDRGVSGGSGKYESVDGKKRTKRDGSNDGKAKVIAQNGTLFDDYKCVTADTIFTHMNPFNDDDVYQQLFAWRFWGILALVIHLLLVLYHTFYNFLHRIPTSQHFNLIFALLGFIVWNLITFWIGYQYFMWEQKFTAATAADGSIHYHPSIPAEFYAFLILSLAMNAVLLYELLTPMHFLSYEITPRQAPSQGYIPATQVDENEYGIIRSISSAPNSPPILSPRHPSPIIRSNYSNY